MMEAMEDTRLLLPINARGEKMFSEKLHEYLLEKPCACDVTFAVGPSKEKVKAVKLVLMVASPVLRKQFEEVWDKGVVKKGEPISIEDVDPRAFELFLTLLPSEHIEVESLKKLKLTPIQNLNMIYIANKYGMRTMETAFRELNKPFFERFGTYAQTPEYWKLSSNHLATILSSDDVPLEEVEIFKHTRRWGEQQCSKKGILAGPDNMRCILGSCLKEIRFPLMSHMEFSKVVLEKNILTAEEVSKLFLYICLGEENRKYFDVTSLGFIINKRNIITDTADNKEEEEKSKEEEEVEVEWSTLRIFEDSELVCDPSFPCTGSKLVDNFTVNNKVELLGIGFAGPATLDGEYEVEVEPLTCGSGQWYSHGKSQQRIKAERNKVFYFMFENPLLCHSSDGTSTYNIRLQYSLKGPHMRKVAKYDNSTSFDYFSRAQDKVTFEIQGYTKQIKELLFKRIEYGKRRLVYANPHVNSYRARKGI